MGCVLFVVVCSPISTIKNCYQLLQVQDKKLYGWDPMFSMITRGARLLKSHIESWHLKKWSATRQVMQLYPLVWHTINDLHNINSLTLLYVILNLYRHACFWWWSSSFYQKLSRLNYYLWLFLFSFYNQLKFSYSRTVLFLYD